MRNSNILGLLAMAAAYGSNEDMVFKEVKRARTPYIKKVKPKRYTPLESKRIKKNRNKNRASSRARRKK